MKIQVSRYQKPRFNVYRPAGLGYAIQTGKPDAPFMTATMGPIAYGKMTRENAAKVLRELRKAKA